MNITNIKVVDFKSIEKVDLNFSEFNILVGQNNHGKTNFLSSIDWFFNGSGTLESVARVGTATAQTTHVEMTFSGVQEALSLMKNAKNKKTLELKIGDSNEVTVRRSFNDKGKAVREILINNEFVPTGTGIDPALNDFLPNFEYVSTDSNLKEILKYGKTNQIGTMLSGVLNEILASGDPEYAKFVEQFYNLFGSENSRISGELTSMANSVKGYLKKQFPECTSVEFEVKTPDLGDLFKNFSANIDDGVKTEAFEKGDGMQRALMLAIIQSYADYRRNKEEIKNFVFVIDEAELHLHPTAQRNLKEAFIELAGGGDQVVITTHSSVLIADDVEGGVISQKIFKVEKDEGVTEIMEHEYGQTQNIIFELLGGSPADLLLPKNFVIVEGKCEMIFFDKVIERFYPEARGLKFIPAFGDFSEAERLVSSIVKLFTPLTDSIYSGKYIVLIDRRKISNEQFEMLLKRVPDFSAENQLKELGVESIEQYYPIATDDQIQSLPPRDRVDSWQKTAEEVRLMRSKQKVRLAKIVGENITKVQFENDMPIFHNAIIEAIRSGF